jgi:hypothetical protein
VEKLNRTSLTVTVLNPQRKRAQSARSTWLLGKESIFNFFTAPFAREAALIERCLIYHSIFSFYRLFGSWGCGATLWRLAPARQNTRTGRDEVTYKPGTGILPPVKRLEAAFTFLPVGSNSRSSQVTESSHIIGTRRDAAAATGPVGVKEFASRLVNALVGVGSEEVALRLKQVGGQARRAVAVEER